MYKVVVNGTYGLLDLVTHLELLPACDIADIHKKRHPKEDYMVVNEDNGDIEYTPA